MARGAGASGWGGGSGGGGAKGRREQYQEKTTLDEYLGKRGLRSPISDYMDDKMRIPHGLTRRQELKMRKEAAEAAAKYSAKREAAILEYESKLASGIIKEKSRVDVLMDRAHGHPDLESTQAARRALKKRGYNWKTGKKL